MKRWIIYQQTGFFFKEELTENSRIKKIKQLTLETQLVGLTVDQRDEKQK